MNFAEESLLHTVSEEIKVTQRAVGQMRGQRDVSVTWDITLKTLIDTAVTSVKSGFQQKNLVLNSTTSLLFFRISTKFIISLFCQRYLRLNIIKQQNKKHIIDDST